MYGLCGFQIEGYASEVTISCGVNTSRKNVTDPSISAPNVLEIAYRLLLAPHAYGHGFGSLRTVSIRLWHSSFMSVVFFGL